MTAKTKAERLEEFRAERRLWEERAAYEASLPLLDLTIPERFRLLEMLYDACRGRHAEIDAVFGPERQRRMIAFQERLNMLGEWERQRGSRIDSNGGRDPAATDEG